MFTPYNMNDFWSTPAKKSLDSNTINENSLVFGSWFGCTVKFYELWWFWCTVKFYELFMVSEVENASESIKEEL
jgi:hypothetical protein